MVSVLNKFPNISSIINRTMCYQSAISLSKLYPNSSLKITTPLQPNTKTDSKFSGVIPMDKLDIVYSRNSVPEGQNVNTVSTKVNLRFHVETADWLDAEIRKKLIENNQTKITKDGYLEIKSELTRSQQLNVADALEKLRTLIRQSESSKRVELSAEKKAKIANRSTTINRERLLLKHQRSQIK